MVMRLIVKADGPIQCSACEEAKRLISLMMIPARILALNPDVPESNREAYADTLEAYAALAWVEAIDDIETKGFPVLVPDGGNMAIHGRDVVDYLECLPRILEVLDACSTL